MHSGAVAQAQRRSSVFAQRERRRAVPRLGREQTSTDGHVAARSRRQRQSLLVSALLMQRMRSAQLHSVRGVLFSCMQCGVLRATGSIALVVGVDRSRRQVGGTSMRRRLTLRFENIAHSASHLNA